MKIAVYAISKNEELFMERFIKSAVEADLILIADTGSTDNTVDIARKHGAVVFDICINPWRFDKARDAALALLPKDIDVCVSIDIDEVLEPGWRQEIEKVWTTNTTRLRYGYDWGNNIRFQYEKIHARFGYSWHHPCHEYPKSDPRIKEVYANTDMLLVRHLPDMTKSRGQYLDLLKVAITEDPFCPRNAFYYARELTFWGKWTDAISELNRYLQLPSATWANERCYAMRLLGKSFEKTGKNTEALMWYRRACAEAPGTREPWCDLAMVCYQHKFWAECYGSIKTALSIKDRQMVYTCDPKVWGSLPHDLCSIAAWNLGLKDEALLHAITASELSPDDKRLKDNVDFIKNQERNI